MLKEAPKLDQSFLKLDDVAASYGPIEVLRRVSLEVRRGEIVCLLGGNAAGKSTTLKTILGLLRPTDGSVALDDQRIDRLPTEDIVRRGIALVPESRRIFARMTVWENLAMGAYSRRGAPPGDFAEDLERVYTLFPRLEERAAQHGGTLSGGEQQMLAIGRALMARPRLLLMDEPSMGLAPVLVEQVFDIIQTINRQGTTILVVEQNAAVALSIAHRGYVLQDGRIVMQGAAAALLDEDHIRRAYLGED
jgi:branched-chain amino acid transport system ATP-binding protein